MKPFPAKISERTSLNFIRLLRVVFSSQQRRYLGSDNDSITMNCYPRMLESAVECWPTTQPRWNSCAWIIPVRRTADRYWRRLSDSAASRNGRQYILPTKTTSIERDWDWILNNLKVVTEDSRNTYWWYARATEHPNPIIPGKQTGTSWQEFYVTNPRSIGKLLRILDMFLPSKRLINSSQSLKRDRRPSFPVSKWTKILGTFVCI